jgi:hypothetical protein
MTIFTFIKLDCQITGYLDSLLCNKKNWRCRLRILDTIFRIDKQNVFGHNLCPNSYTDLTSFASGKCSFFRFACSEKLNSAMVKWYFLKKHKKHELYYDVKHRRNFLLFLVDYRGNFRDSSKPETWLLSLRCCWFSQVTDSQKRLCLKFPLFAEVLA